MLSKLTAYISSQAQAQTSMLRNKRLDEEMQHIHSQQDVVKKTHKQFELHHDDEKHLYSKRQRQEFYEGDDQLDPFALEQEQTKKKDEKIK